jgi:membrane protein
MITQPKLYFEKLINKIRPAYHFINRRLFGALDVFRIATSSFTRAKAPEAAASMAYYTFFSIFPLVLVLISFASFILKSQFVQEQILEYIVDIFPVSPDLITTNIENVLSKRGAVGIIALIGLMWSASNMFNTIALNIDRAWPNEVSHSFIERRMIGFAILVGLTFGIILLWFLKALLEMDFIARLILFFKVPILTTTLWDILVLLAPRAFRLMMYWIMFQWFPKASVRPTEALWGAIVVIILSEAITYLMSWYMSSHWVRYELIYGSLGRIIALLLWIYFSSYVILFGAHISSAVAAVSRVKK